ncbi:CHAT domain-containing protein [Roseateles sp.]|jgi:CHAT domain-containing protein|uniref:CHAT domain-containing tetratricopeptide repeat protein n=1 Tax=Roseateles sp. TaxID=1971397 RepID=UPI0037CBA4E5
MRGWKLGGVACLLAASIGAAASASDLPALREQVSVLQGQAKHGDAAALLQDALARLADPASAQAAELLLMLTEVQNRGGNPKLAAQSAERAWRLRETLFGPGDARTLDALNAYIDHCPAAGLAKQCEPLAAEAVMRYEALGNPGAPGLAALLRSQALIANMLGRAPAALPLLDRAISIWALDTERHAENIFNAQTGKAVLLQNLGRFDEALATVDAVIPAQRARLGLRAMDVMSSLSTRGVLLDQLGRMDEALAQFEEVIKLRTEMLGAEHLQTLQSRTRMGVVLLQMGRIAEANAELEQVAAGARQRYGDGHLTTLHAGHYQALALRAAGLHRQSVDVSTRVMNDQLKVSGDRHPDYVTFLLARAAGLQLAGDVGAALEEFERGLALSESIDGVRHPRHLTAVLNALSARNRAGLEVPAADVGSVAQALVAVRGPEHPQSLTARHLQAHLMGRQGEAQAALPLAQAVSETRDRLLGVGHVDALHAQALVAELLVRLQRPQEALPLLDALVPRVDALRRSLAPLGAAAQRQALEPLQAAIVERIVLLARAGRLEEAFTAAESYKARILLEQLARQRALDGTRLPDGMAQRLQRLVAQSASLEGRIGVAARSSEREPLRGLLQRTHAEIESLIAQAKQYDPRFARLLDVEPAGAQDLALLGEKTALLHFLKGRDQSWYALLRTRRGAPQWFELGVLPDLAAQVEALRAQTTATGRRQVDAEVLTQQLGGRLLAPLHHALVGTEQLLLSPDGVLALLPWDILQLQGRPALQRFAVSLTPSLSVFKLAREVAPQPRAKGLLALAASDGGLAQGQVWPALPHAQREALAAAKLFSDQGGRAITGAAASETALRSLAASGELAGYRRLLIAAHGRFEPGRPEAQGLILAADGSDATRDGVVGLADWVALPLRSQLVILSGCDTGQGQLVAGEGLVGFAYALNVAGNRDLLATLWPISDGLAAEFVLDFLARVRRGTGHVQALVQAKRAFASHANARLRDPRIWAAFVLVGQ